MATHALDRRVEAGDALVGEADIARLAASDVHSAALGQGDFDQLSARASKNETGERRLHLHGGTHVSASWRRRRSR